MKRCLRYTRASGPPDLRMAARELALFLDVDGTLAPITPRPDMTCVPMATRRTLHALQQQGVALAAVSGRPLTQVRRLLLPLDIPMAGSHGAELSLTEGRGRRLLPQVAPGMLASLQHAVDALPGVWLERKPGSFAVHWREAPQHQGRVSSLMKQMVVRFPGWQLIQGHSVHELRRKGRDKGMILKRLMALPDFAGRWPLAIGDDLTDEDAFKAALAMGGGAIHVGPGLDTVAPWWLADVPALAHWLRKQAVCLLD